MNNKKIFIIILILLFSISNKTFALKQAIFPNGQSLQPLPPDVHANISGNINSTTEIAPEYQSNIQAEDKKATVVQTEKSPSSKNNTPILIWPLLLLGLIIVFFIYKFIRKENNII